MRRGATFAMGMRCVVEGQASLRDARGLRDGPGLESPGYLRTSLRDAD